MSAKHHAEIHANLNHTIRRSPTTEDALLTEVSKTNCEIESHSFKFINTCVSKEVIGQLHLGLFTRVHFLMMRKSPKCKFVI